MWDHEEAQSLSLHRQIGALLILLLKWLDSSEAAESYFRFLLLHRKHSLTMVYSRSSLSLCPIILVGVDLFCQCNWKIRLCDYGLGPQLVLFGEEPWVLCCWTDSSMDSTFYVRTETKIFKFGEGSRRWIFLFQTLLLEKSIKPHALWKVLVSEVLDFAPFLQGDVYLFQSLKRSFSNLVCFVFF